VNPFRSLRDYETFVYTLPHQFPRILRSTLTVSRRGRYRAEVMGELLFPAGIRLSVYEHLTWDEGAVVIEGYSYEAWRGSEKLYCTTHSHTRTIPRWQPPIPITSTSHPTSNTIVSRLPG